MRKPSSSYIRNPTIYVHDFLKGNYEVLLQTLTSDCYNSTYVEFVWSLIKRHIIIAMELCIHQFKIRTHQYPKWFTTQLRHHVKCMRTLWKNTFLFHS